MQNTFNMPAKWAANNNNNGSFDRWPAWCWEKENLDQPTHSLGFSRWLGSLRISDVLWDARRGVSFCMFGLALVRLH